MEYNQRSLQPMAQVSITLHTNKPFKIFKLYMCSSEKNDKL